MKPDHQTCTFADRVTMLIMKVHSIILVVLKETLMLKVKVISKVMHPTIMTFKECFRILNPSDHSA